jgi:hypothetical protein
MEKKMIESLENMENSLVELKQSMYDMFLHNLHERLPKGDNKMQGNHENVEEIKIKS